MPKNVVKRGGGGGRDIIPEVFVVNAGDHVISWECGNYSGDGNDVQFVLNPGESEPFDMAYAKELFCDWTIDKTTMEGKRTWANMLSTNIRRFPGGYTNISCIVVKDNKGETLWDGPTECARFLQDFAAMPGMIAKPVAGTPGRFNMPEVLAKAGQEDLRVLWEKVFKCKMPGAMRLEDARGCLLPHLTAEQIKDALTVELGPDAT